VIEEETIGRAADRLGLSQPTLSRQLRQLERDLGVTLLERAPRGIVPTTAGESLYRDSRGILDEVARLPAEVARGQRATEACAWLQRLPQKISVRFSTRCCARSIRTHSRSRLWSRRCPLRCNRPRYTLLGSTSDSVIRSPISALNIRTSIADC
jgi:DNA-binding transcriptional ArsR family regulator